MAVLVSVVVSLAVGFVVAWPVSRHYYQRSQREKPEWMDSSLEEILGRVIDDKVELELTTKEITRLFSDRIYDFEQAISGCDPSKFKACPVCGAKDLRISKFSDIDHFYYSVDCGYCGWEHSISE